MRFVILLLLVTGPLLEQTNETALTNRPANGTNPPPKEGRFLKRQVESYLAAMERIRLDCIQGRRIICGRIEKVLPDGLIVDSGYTNLMRPPLDRSWLVPGTVAAKQEPNLVEGKEPDDVCVGLVFLTDPPKSKQAKPKAFDYVVIRAYPAGEHTYTTVGTVQRTVRHFSASLPTAMQINRQAAGIQPPACDPAGK